MRLFFQAVWLVLVCAAIAMAVLAMHAGLAVVVGAVKTWWFG